MKKTKQPQKQTQNQKTKKQKKQKNKKNKKTYIGGANIENLRVILDKLYFYYTSQGYYPIITGGFAIYLYTFVLFDILKKKGISFPEEIFREPTDVDLILPFTNRKNPTNYPDNFKSVYNTQDYSTATAHDIDTTHGSTFILRDANGEVVASADVIREWGTTNIYLSKQQKEEYLVTRTNMIGPYRVISLRELLLYLRQIMTDEYIRITSGKTIEDRDKKIVIVEKLIDVFTVQNNMFI